NPKVLPSLCQMFANHKRQLRSDLRAMRQTCEEARATLARLREPPWFPADLLAVRADNRLEVVLGGRRQIVGAAPELGLGALRPGDEVLLGHELTAAIALGAPGRRCGLVGVVTAAASGSVVLTGAGGEEIAAACASDLASTLRPGDRVVYHR